MNINIFDLASRHGEVITVKPLGDIEPDEFGMESNEYTRELKTNCIVSEEMINVMDAKSGSYLRKVVYELYIPSNIKKNLIGATVTRNNGQELVITNRTIDRPYSTHTVYEATERRVYDDRF